jgi:hypothetical protein
MNTDGTVVWEFHQNIQDAYNYEQQAEQIYNYFKDYEKVIFSFHTPLGFACDPS